MKLDTIRTLTDDIAKTLINEHIHFTWHNKSDHTVSTMPGKVLDYKDGTLTIYTLDIIYKDISDELNDTNENVLDIDIDDIYDVYVFDTYTNNFWELLEPITESDINSTLFKVEDIYGNSVVSKLLREDILSITIMLEGAPYDYPTYFIKSIEAVSKH